MNEFVKQEIERLKVILDALSKNEVNMIVRGERPKEMNHYDFKVIRKTIQDQIKNKRKGKTFYPAFGTIKDANGKEQRVQYQPYNKKKQEELKNQNNGK